MSIHQHDVPAVSLPEINGADFSSLEASGMRRQLPSFSCLSKHKSNNYIKPIVIAKKKSPQRKAFKSVPNMKPLIRKQTLPAEREKRFNLAQIQKGRYDPYELLQKPSSKFSTCAERAQLMLLKYTNKKSQSNKNKKKVPIAEPSR